MSQATNHNEQNEPDFGRLFRGLLRALRRLWPLVLVFAVLGSGFFLLYKRKTYVPDYKAYCTFAVRVVNKAATGEANTSFSVYYDKDLAEQMDKTFSYVLTSDLLTDPIREYLGDTPVEGRVEASSIPGSNIFMLVTYGRTPEDAQRLLEAVMSVYMEAAQFIIGEMETELVEEPVVSDVPVNAPSLAEQAVKGLILGLIPGLGLILFYAALRRTVLDPEELEQYVNMPCLGVLPFVNMKKMRKNLKSGAELSSGESSFREGMRGIARKLETELKKRGGKVILVTGTLPEEGKSTVSKGLAETLASWGRKVVLIDGDLRKPDLARRFDVKDREMPLEEVFAGKKPLQSVVFQQNNLALVGNTKPVADATVVLEQSETKDLIRRLADATDYLILDAPPCSQLADAAILSNYADGILYVVRQDRVPIPQIADAASALGGTDNLLVGFVLNGAEEQGGSYGYGKYGYGKYGYGRYGYGHYGRYGRYNRYREKNEE